MSLLDSIKTKFSEMSFFQKLMAVLLFPVTLIGLVLKARSLIEGLTESSKREETDSRAKELEEKIRETDKKISKEEGKLEALEESKKKAIESSDSQDSISFHNSRKK